MLLNLYGRSKNIVHEKEFIRELIESICQSFVTNTNLENTAISKYCRKATFYFNLLFHILQLLLIFLMTKLAPENVPFYGNIPLAKDKHSMLVFGVISVVGLLSLLLDLIYSCFNNGVYNSSIMQTGGEATLQIPVINDKTNTSSFGEYI